MISTLELSGVLLSLLNSINFRIKTRENCSYVVMQSLVYPNGLFLAQSCIFLYTTPLGYILRGHGVKYHLYADDTQMY